MQRDPVQEIARRTQRYWYEDGIWEIGFGVINLLLGLFYLAGAQVNWEGPLAIALMLLQMGVLIGAFALINRIVRFLKERITYPRTGYVAYRKPAGRKRAGRFLLALLLSVGLGALISLVSKLRLAENSMPLVVALVMAGMLTYLGYRFDLVRLYGVALLVILFGYGLSRYPLPQMNSTGIFFTGLGLLILGSGLLTLINYLRRTRPVALDYEAPTGEPAPGPRDEP